MRNFQSQLTQPAYQQLHREPRPLHRDWGYDRTLQVRNFRLPKLCNFRLPLTALRESHGTTREQRCWLHKTGNVLNKLPKSLQAKAKGHLQDIWMAETKDRAEKAFDFFLEAYGAKYDKATACLAKDRAGLLAFYDFPAEHWKHLRTTNPIESTFATVRLRTIKTKGCLSRTTALTMVFKLCQSAARKWRRLDGSHHLVEIVEGVKFKDGEKLIERAA